MVDPSPELSAERLGAIAAHYTYPPTPDIAAYERRRLSAGQPAALSPARLRPARLLVGALATLLLLLAAALIVPQTRAALLEFLNIGAIRILVDEEPAMSVATPGRSLLDIAGATTLAEAAGMVNFEVRLPAHPADLGPPDHVFVQRLVPGGRDPVLILVWLDPTRPDQVRLSLYQIGVPYYGLKQALQENVRETTVSGQPAVWVEGPHSLQLQSGDYQEWYFVPGSVLIWTDGEVTYRLEGGLSVEESVRIAESLVAGG